MKRCAITGCSNNEHDTPSKYFFTSTSNPTRRVLWVFATGKTYADKARFLVCEDHFDLRLEEDLDYFDVVRKRPVLKTQVTPHINIGEAQGSKADAVTGCSAICSCGTFFKSFEEQSCQTDIEMFDVGKVEKSEVVQSSSSGSTSTSGAQQSSSDVSYNPEQGESTDSDNEDESDDDSKDEFFEDLENVGLEDEEKKVLCELTLKIIENNIRHYTGIPKESAYIVEAIVDKLKITSKRNIFLVLRKIRHNETLQILGDVFGISRQMAGNIFASEVEKISTFFRAFIYWPEAVDIKRNLPLQFKHKFPNVQIIIDCWETSIAKPSNPLDQALSWSEYKHSNTVKHLIGATPDGFISFSSVGYTGRITDNEIVRRSGILNYIKKGTEVMADRGFKDILTEITSRGGILHKPPSTTAGVRFTAAEAKLCKSVAATRIHIERVISRLRNFVFLKPHNSLLMYKRTHLLEFAIVIASGICNIQGLLIKI